MDGNDEFEAGVVEGLKRAYLVLLRKVEDRENWPKYEHAVRLLEEIFPQLRAPDG
jgi:hypothetical protein